ncbi:MAG: discoidin domain-containing protein, partial [Lentisphaeria bacterium]|nr:discoidin domain-containing protein [Lentisphaeria bacterium]
LVYDGDVIIEDGKGPKLDAYRAFVNNDTWGFSGWFNKGLHKLQHKVANSQSRTNKDGSIVLSFTVISQAKNDTRVQGGTSTNGVTLTDGKREFGEFDFRFVTNQDWTIYADGSIELQSSITSNDPNFVLPRIGYSMTIPKEYKEFTYYGRGPINNYNDRESAQFIQKYETTVKEQVLNFPKPQDMGNRENVRWCALTKGWLGKTGAVFIATGDMSVSATPYTDLDLATKGHLYELPKAGDTVLHLDAKVSGLGGNSCGQGGPLSEDRAYASQRNFGFIIRPASKDLDKVANVSGSAKSPLAITRDRGGKVTVSAGKVKDTLCFTLDGGKVQEFKKSFMLRSAGTVTAWYKGSKETSTTTIKFSKIDKIETIVVFTSSQENSGNDSAKNLTDGNPETTWHSMYSVTVAQYPHWVDFDGGDLKTIKGFTYLPRQDGGNNGDIKGYSIQTSLDGKTWSKVIAKGRFSRDKKEKRVLFNKPVKTRFVRFTAVSSQNGQDFAGGAEFSLLAD